MSTKKFTVIELIASLAVFSIIMVILMNFFVQAQNVKKITEAISRVQANAQLVFDTIENDLRHAVASKEYGREIPFAMINDPKGYGPFPLMVATLANDAAENYSSLAEITYKVDTYEANGTEFTDIKGDPVLFFKRCATTDDNGTDTNWDFYGEKAGDSPTKWKKNGSNFYPIARGIVDIQCNARMPVPTFQNYVDAGTPKSNGVDNPMCGGRVVIMKEDIIAVTRNYNNLPTCVDVEVTLYDPQTEAASNPLKTKKTFFKRIYLKQGPRNYDIQF